MADAPLPDPERRQPNRLVVSACPQCGTNERVVPVLRTDFEVYFRCLPCGQVWSAPKPAMSTDLHGEIVDVGRMRSR